MIAETAAKMQLLEEILNRRNEEKKEAAESMCDEMKLKGDILLDTNNDEVVGLSRPG